MGRTTYCHVVIAVHALSAEQHIVNEDHRTADVISCNDAHRPSTQSSRSIKMTSCRTQKVDVPLMISFSCRFFPLFIRELFT